MKPWKRIEPTTVHQVGYRTIVTKTYVLPDGRTADFQTLGGERTACIATIALTSDNRVIIARQFRPGPEKIMDELPGGGMDPHESEPEAAARRELLEETGYEAGEMHFLGNACKDAYRNTIWHFFLATGCTPHPHGQQLDEHEHIEVRLISIDELLDNARQSRMTDVEAVFLAYEMLAAIAAAKEIRS